MHCDAEKAGLHQNSLAKNIQSNRWSFKSSVFCREHWAVRSITKAVT